MTVKKGCVIWLTGLPSSGKTTLAHALEASLLGQGLQSVCVLDGDSLRRTLSPDLGYSARDRTEHAKRVINKSNRLVHRGCVVIVALISPYRLTRSLAKTTLKNFLEVYVKCPIEICITRDVKGLYRKALKGEISNMTGISDPFEEPLSPDVIVKTDSASVEECVDSILIGLIGRNYIAAAEEIVVPA